MMNRLIKSNWASGFKFWMCRIAAKVDPDDIEVMLEGAEAKLWRGEELVFSDSSESSDS